jgi:hypothetical protein
MPNVFPAAVVATILLFSGGVGFSASAAGMDRSRLVPVSASNQTRCVEYYQLDEQVFCSPQPLQPRQATEPADGAGGPFKIVFDKRPWVLGWQAADGKTIREYLPKGQDINAWKELITTNSFPGLQQRLTPEKLMLSNMATLRKTGLEPKFNILRLTPDEAFFEFSIQGIPTQNQHELQRIVRGPTGLYSLHYVVKQPVMSKADRQAWIERLSAARLR